jgi:hypothetical protein
MIVIEFRPHRWGWKVWFQFIASGTPAVKSHYGFFEIASVLLRFDHVASRIVNAVLVPIAS